MLESGVPLGPTLAAWMVARLNEVDDGALETLSLHLTNTLQVDGASTLDGGLSTGIGTWVFAGNQLTIDAGGSGDAEIELGDNYADALTFSIGAIDLLTFITTDTAEGVSFVGTHSVTASTTVASASGAVLNAVTFPAAAITVTGSDAITTATGFNFINVAIPAYTSAANITNAATVYIAGAPSITGGGAITNAYAWWVDAGAVRFDGAVQFFGDAGTNLTITPGATSLVMLFTGATGESEIHVTDNLADALSVKIPSGNDLIVLDTRDGQELITLGGTATGVRDRWVESTPDATTAVTVDVSDSGRMFIQLDADENVTYQLPATQNGLLYGFFCGHAGGEINVSPAAADKITGKGIAGADDQDIENDSGTNTIGDVIWLLGDGVDGWLVIDMLGTWSVV